MLWHDDAIKVNCPTLLLYGRKDKTVPLYIGKKLGFGENVKVYKDKVNIPSNAVCVVAPGVEAYLPLNELIDKEAELERINKEREKLNLELVKLEGMLNNQGFLTKAPEVKVKEIKIRSEELKVMISNLDSQKQNILSMYPVFNKKDVSEDLNLDEAIVREKNSLQK